LKEKAAEARCKLARKYLIDFTTYTFRQYQADAAHRLLARTLERVIAGDLQRLMIFAPPQHGKLIAHETPVLTPGGWRLHGDLRPGDRVFGDKGQPVTVLAVSAEGEANREIEFTDGASIQCHAAHEWVVFDRAGHRPSEVTMETDTMASLGVWIGEQGKRGGRGRFQVDANVCVHFEEADLPLHPYILGAWLGDGTATKNCITHHPDDQPIVDKIERLGMERTSICTHPTTGILSSYFRKLYGVLMAMGLMGHKRIPETYLCSSIDQRLELLAGLLDTDGYVYPNNGRVTFSTTDPELVEGVSRLVVSLGWRVTVSEAAPFVSTSGIEGKRAVYQVTFNPTIPIPVALERKQGGRINPTRRRRAIRQIREIEPVPGRCIQVEGEIYLVGPTLIPTHNSELVSVRLPAFWMAHRPDDPIILTSYAASLAYSKSRQARNLVESDECRELFPGVKTNPGSRAVDHWELAPPHRGGMLAAGVGGPITGHGAALGIIDDPFENWAQAYSETVRAHVWDWYRTTFRTRIWEGGAIVIIMTRWHEDDLCGRLLLDQGESWEVLRLPALGETQEDRDRRNRRLGIKPGQPDPLGRKPGEPLCPSRYSAEALGELRRDVGSLAWEGQYMGSPTLPEGNRIKRAWLPIVDAAPAKAARVRYWDLAGSESDAAKRTAGIRMAGPVDGVYYVEHAITGKWTTGARNKVIRQVAETDGKAVKIRIEQEPGSSGLDTARDLVKLLAGFAIRPDRVTGDKDVRLEPFAAQAEGGNVKLVRGDWNGDYIEELCAVPTGRYRDQADATAGAFNELSRTGWVRGASG